MFGALPAFRDLSTWRAWCVFLATFYGLPFSDLAIVGVTEAEALTFFQKHTGRTAYEPRPGGFPEAVAIIGRQSGKDRIAATVQAYEAMTAVPEGDGTDLFALTVCQDARASLRTQFAYSSGAVSQSADAETARPGGASGHDRTQHGRDLASYPCRPQALRGVRARVVICSELAFFQSTEGNPVDVEILRAVRPTLATTGGKLLILSSPYTDAGALHELHRKHFGVDDSAVLVWQATAPDMNPTLPADYLARMEQDDPEAYRSEVLGEFRAVCRSCLTRPCWRSAWTRALRERPAEPGCRYLAHTDAASGTGKDAWTLAIGHIQSDRGRARPVPRVETVVQSIGRDG